MNVLYHLTIPPAPNAGLEAVTQEVTALQSGVAESRIMRLYPGKKPGTRLPRRWWGLNKLPALRRAEKRIDLHHLFNPDPYPFWLLRFLRKPVVYTAVAGIGRAPRQTIEQTAQKVHTLVVPAPAEADKLQSWGVGNTAVILPGIDADRFQYAPPPVPPPFTLMMGSAPWTRAQFRSKGVDALLEAARLRPDLRLIFLWRGVLAGEMARRVADAGLSARVTVYNERVDVNRILARVHASVVLADDPALVKAYPHSLLESLAAGKPALVSRALPMADYVKENRCGQAVAEVSAAGVLDALENLTKNYARCSQNALLAGRRDFSLNRFMAAYQNLYRGIVSEK